MFQKDRQRDQEIRSRRFADRGWRTGMGDPRELAGPVVLSSASCAVLQDQPVLRGIPGEGFETKFVSRVQARNTTLVYGQTRF